MDELHSKSTQGVSRSPTYNVRRRLRTNRDIQNDLLSFLCQWYRLFFTKHIFCPNSVVATIVKCYGPDNCMALTKKKTLISGWYIVPAMSSKLLLLNVFMNSPWLIAETSAAAPTIQPVCCMYIGTGQNTTEAMFAILELGRQNHLAMGVWCGVCHRLHCWLNSKVTLTYLYLYIYIYCWHSGTANTHTRDTHASCAIHTNAIKQNQNAVSLEIRDARCDKWWHWHYNLDYFFLMYI